MNHPQGPILRTLSMIFLIYLLSIMGCDSFSNNEFMQDGAIRIENNTSVNFELLNIVPCAVSYYPWGPNQMLNESSLDPSEDYQINGIPEGCYSVRACVDTDAPDNAGCIVYHQNIYVEKGKLYTINLGAG